LQALSFVTAVLAIFLSSSAFAETKTSIPGPGGVPANLSSLPATVTCGPVGCNNNGIQDNGETGIDCGGPCPAVCTYWCTTAVACAGGAVCPVGKNCWLNDPVTCVATAGAAGYCGGVTNGPCGQPTCYRCSGASCVQDNGAGTFAVANCSNTCVAGATCSDGIQNQGEIGVDCGGPCPACGGGGGGGGATCNDGVQNQGEAGIDCGGPCPSPCPVICDDCATVCGWNEGLPGGRCGNYPSGGAGCADCHCGPAGGTSNNADGCIASGSPDNDDPNDIICSGGVCTWNCQDYCNGDAECPADCQISMCGDSNVGCCGDATVGFCGPDGDGDPCRECFTLGCAEAAPDSPCPGG
jgi:hypothetical protein